jgi:hypothetical protein
MLHSAWTEFYSIVVLMLYGDVYVTVLIHYAPRVKFAKKKRCVFMLEVWALECVIKHASPLVWLIIDTYAMKFC